MQKGNERMHTGGGKQKIHKITEEKKKEQEENKISCFIFKGIRRE